MIYTIGYDHMTADDLGRVVQALEIQLLIDVRSVPFSRRPGFTKAALAARFGEVYQWRGNILGGRGAGPTVDGIRQLIPLGKIPAHSVLLCKEEAPGECHRHYTIAVPLLEHRIDCTHIFQDQLIAASEFQASLDEDREYFYDPFTL